MKRIFFLLLIFSSFLGGFLLRSYLPFNKEQPAKTIQAEEKLVTKVIDGDTIIIATGDHIRYEGIDAPEQNEPYGLSSAKYNENLVLGKEVRLEFDQEKFDNYGRILAYVWLKDMLINEKMIEEGYAKVYTIAKTKKPKYLDRLQKAQQWAKDHHNGMWLEEWK